MVERPPCDAERVTIQPLKPIDPSQLRIVRHPDPVLRQKATPIPEVTTLVRDVAQRMIELMRSEDGAGLAAPQVGLSWRMFVVEIPPDEAKGRSVSAQPATATLGPIVYINPRLATPSGAVEGAEEGCLSLPGIWGEVLRAPVVTIRATGLDAQPFESTAAGLLARCWQHEMDHLDGVLILDRMTQASRLKNRSKVRELERE